MSNLIVYPTFSKKIGSAAIFPKQDNLFETKKVAFKTGNSVNNVKQAKTPALSKPKRNGLPLLV